ncbi:unnamed protein product [Pleuronectes platessa]|uniref:Uncharacterized protein n=1 Tax=Pleuronectes platessa TaxID=8262 RepID=A0A9N7U0J7_PLEPL|nr:unnamed protein product [Pleuronectes platessa]
MKRIIPSNRIWRLEQSLRSVFYSLAGVALFGEMELTDGEPIATPKGSAVEALLYDVPLMTNTDDRSLLVILIKMNDAKTRSTWRDRRRGRDCDDGKRRRGGREEGTKWGMRTGGIGGKTRVEDNMGLFAVSSVLFVDPCDPERIRK